MKPEKKLLSPVSQSYIDETRSVFLKDSVSSYNKIFSQILLGYELVKVICL